MMVVLEDDACLHVYPSPEALARDVEPRDAPDVLRAVFDDRGQRYRVDWIERPRDGFFSYAHGAYRLVPDGEPDPAALLALIRASRAADADAAAIGELAHRLGRV